MATQTAHKGREREVPPGPSYVAKKLPRERWPDFRPGQHLLVVFEEEGENVFGRLIGGQDEGYVQAEMEDGTSEAMNILLIEWDEQHKRWVYVYDYDKARS